MQKFVVIPTILLFDDLDYYFLLEKVENIRQDSINYNIIVIQFHISEFSLSAPCPLSFLKYRHSDIILLSFFLTFYGKLISMITYSLFHIYSLILHIFLLLNYKPQAFRIKAKQNYFRLLIHLLLQWRLCSFKLCLKYIS